MELKTELYEMTEQNRKSEEFTAVLVCANDDKDVQIENLESELNEITKQYWQKKNELLKVELHKNESLNEEIKNVKREQSEMAELNQYLKKTKAAARIEREQLEQQCEDLKEKHRELNELKAVADRRDEKNQELITRLRNLTQEFELAQMAPEIRNSQNTNINVEPMDTGAAEANEFTENREGGEQEGPITDAAEMGYPDGINREESNQTTSHNRMPGKQREWASVTANKKGRFVCKTCGKSFPLKANYVRHQSAHIDGKPFKCKCGREFKQNGNFIRHIRLQRCIPTLKLLIKKLNSKSSTYLNQ